MSYAIKDRIGRLRLENGKIQKFSNRFEAMRFMVEQLSPLYVNGPDVPRIVKLKPRADAAVLDEAAIRRAERLRIANAVKSNEYVTTLFGYGISGQVREKDIGSNIITALSRSDAEWEPGE